MIRTIALPLALGFALAAPISASAAYGLHHTTRPIHYRTVVARAEPRTPVATIAPAAATHSALELQGLTRNPNDCAKYGCIGNN